MNPGIRPGYVPPEPGQDKEEPELADEDDIPSDDGGEGHPGGGQANEDPAERE